MEVRGAPSDTAFVEVYSSDQQVQKLLVDWGLISAPVGEAIASGDVGGNTSASGSSHNALER